MYADRTGSRDDFANDPRFSRAPYLWTYIRWGVAGAGGFGVSWKGQHSLEDGAPRSPILAANLVYADGERTKYDRDVFSAPKQHFVFQFPE